MEKQDKKYKPSSFMWGIILFGIFSWWYFLTVENKDWDKEQEKSNNPQSKYYNPKPQPGREVYKFDYDNNRWVYMDEVDLRPKSQVNPSPIKPRTRTKTREKTYTMTQSELEDWAEEYLEDNYNLEDDPW